MAAPSEPTRARVVGKVVDHMVTHHRENPAFLEVWRAVDGSPELRALNRQDNLLVAEAVTAAVLSIKPNSDRPKVMSRVLIASEAASATVKLAQELPADLRPGLYENLKSVLASMLAEAM